MSKQRLAEEERTHYKPLFWGEVAEKNDQLYTKFSSNVQYVCVCDSQKGGRSNAGCKLWGACGCTAVAHVSSEEWELEARAPCGPKNTATNSLDLSFDG